MDTNTINGLILEKKEPIFRSLRIFYFFTFLLNIFLIKKLGNMGMYKIFR